MYRTSRFVQSVRIVTFKDVNVEELPAKDVVGRGVGGGTGAWGAGRAAGRRAGTRPGATRWSPATGGAATASSTWSSPGAGELVFCEVKTRSSDRFGVPAEAVTPAKQRRLRLLAARFLAAGGAAGATGAGPGRAVAAGDGSTSWRSRATGSR